jgi:dTDP-4-dehydrorhamnose 3,5-epimerase
MGKMEFIQTDLPGVIIIKPRLIEDERGFFMETFQQHKFDAAGIESAFVQDNHSRSMKHTLRGLHYQLQHAQGKLVRVVAGEIYDAVVDIRRSSPAFGRWVGVTLSSKDKNQLWVPPGFAHGFFVVSDWAEVLYKVTDYYDQPAERCIRWNDPALNISWPIPLGSHPILSAKDNAGKLLAEAEVYP